MDYSFLGMRGQFELCNGSGSYADWIQKSKFLGVKSLAITEHNTLAGALLFQQECQKAGMPFILGETITVKDELFKPYLAKCYALNEQGWFNLLYINKIINVDNEGSPHISELELLGLGEGVALALDPECKLTEDMIDKFSESFDKIYFQVDLTKFKGQEKDQNRLLAHLQ